MRLFTSATCSPCKGLKSWIAQQGITSIQEVDVQENIEEVRKLGFRIVPTLEVDGKLYSGNEEIRPFLESLNGTQ